MDDNKFKNNTLLQEKDLDLKADIALLLLKLMIQFGYASKRLLVIETLMVPKISQHGTRSIFKNWKKYKSTYKVCIQNRILYDITKSYS